MPLAYIDPGSGTMLIQLLLAGALAVPFFFRRVIADGWRRVRGERAEPPTGAASSDRDE